MRLTGGQALARQLVLEGVTEVFGVPGVQLDWAVDGLRQLGNQIHYIVPRHEQTTAYMADGYARTTGRIGTCMVVPGPGLLNAMAGLATAYACNSRVLAIVGNIYSAAIGKGFGLLHEVRNQSEILGSVTKWHAQARSPKDIPGLVREAVSQLRSGRPQPVGVEIAHDLLAATDDIDLVQPNPNEDGRVRPDAAAVEQAAALLAQAKLPVIYVGGGALAARALLSLPAALQALAEKLDAPVVMSENGRGALSDRHPLALNALSGRVVFAHADVALIVGSRFADTTRWVRRPGVVTISNTFGSTSIRSPGRRRARPMSRSKPMLASAWRRLPPRCQRRRRRAISISTRRGHGRRSNCVVRPISSPGSARCARQFQTTAFSSTN